MRGDQLQTQTPRREGDSTRQWSSGQQGTTPVRESDKQYTGQYNVSGQVQGG